MANVTVNAQFMLNTGELVSMSGTLAEGTESELQTSTTYSTAATSLGQFANGKVLTQIVQPPTAPNGIAYAYIERRGAWCAARRPRPRCRSRLAGGLRASRAARCAHWLCVSTRTSSRRGEAEAAAMQQQMGQHCATLLAAARCR